MKQLQLKILDLGEMTVCKNELVRTPKPEDLVLSPVTAVLLRHPTAGNILYDTGNAPDWASSYNAAMKQRYPVTRFISITQALANEGLCPADINILILSHMHFDHAGGLRQFSHTKAGANVLVSQLELTAAMRERRKPDSAYISSLFYDLPGVAFQTLAGDYEVAPGVSLFPQRCHTEGLLGLRVQLSHTRTVLFTSDSIYTEEAFEQELPPGGSINASSEEFYENLRVIRAMQEKEQATLYFGHDIAQARRWQSRGWID